MIRIHNDRDDLLFAVRCPRIHPLGHPRLCRQLHTYLRSIGECRFYRRRQYQLSAIAQTHRCAIDLVRSHVVLPVVQIPSTPEPAQVLAALTLDLAEEVRWRGMLERPVANVFTKRPVETLRPQDLLP